MSEDLERRFREMVGPPTLDPIGCVAEFLEALIPQLEMELAIAGPDAPVPKDIKKAMEKVTSALVQYTARLQSAQTRGEQ